MRSKRQNLIIGLKLDMFRHANPCKLHKLQYMQFFYFCVFFVSFDYLHILSSCSLQGWALASNRCVYCDLNVKLIFFLTLGRIREQEVMLLISC